MDTQTLHPFVIVEHVNLKLWAVINYFKSFQSCRKTFHRILQPGCGNLLGKPHSVHRAIVETGESLLQTATKLEAHSYLWMLRPNHINNTRPMVHLLILLAI